MRHINIITIFVVGLCMSSIFTDIAASSNIQQDASITATNVTVGQFDFIWETSSTKGLRIYSLFLRDTQIIAEAYQHGIRYQLTAFGSAVDVDISSMSRESLNYGDGSTGDNTSYYVEAVYSKAVTNGKLYLKPRFEVVDSNITEELIFSLSFKWTNSGGGSMYSMEALWKIDFDIPSWGSDNCWKYDGSTWTQIVDEDVVDPASYTGIYFYGTGNPQPYIQMPANLIGIPASTSAPGSVKWACISNWENDHRLSPNDDGDNTQNTDIWGAWQIYKLGSWTSGTWYGKYSKVRMTNY